MRNITKRTAELTRDAFSDEKRINRFRRAALLIGSIICFGGAYKISKQADMAEVRLVSSGAYKHLQACRRTLELLEEADLKLGNGSSSVQPDSEASARLAETAAETIVPYSGNLAYRIRCAQYWAIVNIPPNSEPETVQKVLNAQEQIESIQQGVRIDMLRELSTINEEREINKRNDFSTFLVIIWISCLGVFPNRKEEDGN